MRVSELEFTTEMSENVWRGHSVEMPNNDAHRIVSNPDAAKKFVESFGDVEIEWNDKYRYWAVAEFADSRKRYGDIKQVHCDAYGCE